MASPFSIFRKHQKTLIAISGVVLMLVFVVGDPLSMFVRGGGGGPKGSQAANAVAVRWNGGKITNAELHNLVMRRLMVNDLVRAVEYAGRQSAMEAGIDPRQLRVEPIVGPGTPQEGVESDVVRVKVFAQAARDAGMHVSDENVLHYLDELGRQRVSREEMRGLMNRMQAGGRRAAPDYLVEALREEMLARNYLASYQFALETVTPEQRWQDWLQVNDRIVLEAAAIPTAASLVDVPEPTDAELTEFFDKYKNREAGPDSLGTVELPSATPGFAIPRKIDVQYIRAEFEPFRAKVEAEVTDEEISKYYEEHKAEFIKADTSLMDSLGIKPEATDTGATQTPPTTEAPPATEGEKPATDTPPADSEPAAPATEQTPPTTEQTPPATEQSPPPSEQTPAVPEQTPPATDDQAPGEPAKGDESLNESTRSQSPFRFAAFLQNADENKTDAPTAENKDAAAGTTGEEAAKADSESPSAPAAGEQPVASPAATDAAGTAAATPPAAEKPVEYQPLDQVRDVIRRRIAEDKVARQLIDQMSKLQSQLNTEFNKYFTTVLQAQDKKEEPPAPPAALADLSALAQQNGLQFNKTGPMSFLELREQPFGKAASVDDNIPLLNILFGKDLALYQPKLGFDIDGNRFLVMKTSDIPGRVPELKEVRDEVVKAWKQVEAAKLAQNRGDELAKKIQDSGTSLADYFADDKSIQVVRTDPFSWYTGGDVSQFTGQQQPFRLGVPDPIVAAGPEFMQKVFGLSEKEVAAVPNHDRSEVYIVRVAEHQFTPDQLHAAYLSEADSWPGLQIMTRAHARQAVTAVMSDILSSAGIKWERQNDLSPEQQEAEN